MKFRNIVLTSGVEILLGKDEKQNEELVNQFKEKENTIIHTVKPGSPFCIINDLKYLKRDVKEAAIFCAGYSQDWRDNKGDVEVHVFTGKDVYKRRGMKTGTFGVRSFKVLKVKKKEIEVWKQKP